MRVASPSARCAEVDGVTGRRYRPDAAGVYDMTPRDAKALIAYGGFRPSELGVTSRALGFRCPECGFGSWFRTCSKCGHQAAREG